MRIFKWIFKIIGIMVLLLALVMAGFTGYLFMGKQRTAHLNIDDVPVQAVADGIYTGHYNGFRWTNTVKVTVSNHRIQDIIIVKKPTFGKDEVLAQLISTIKEKQSLRVDAISGATVDSKAISKAVEDALKQGIPK